MAVKFPSAAWIKELEGKLNASESYAQAAATWEGDQIFVILPDDDYHDTSYFYIDLRHGKASGARQLRSPARFEFAWTEDAGGVALDLSKAGPPLYQDTQDNFDYGMSVTSMINQQLYSLGWMADVPAGAYQVTVTLGDAWYPRDQMQVKANGTVVTPAGGLGTAAGEFTVVSFPLSVSGSAVELEFGDLGGDPYWTASAVTIRPAVTAGTLSGTVGSVPADGMLRDTVTQTGLTSGDLYTVSSTLGTITTADANPRYAGIQVAVVGGTLSFQVQRPLTTGTATVTAQEMTGKASATGSATDTVAPLRGFEFNGPSSGRVFVGRDRRHDDTGQLAFDAPRERVILRQRLYEKQFGSANGD